ncbi:hypothetical protein SEEHN189_01457 [Salmonella enterica subsp. enterica serovar Heidelberg str. N189]|nr:hypothetical protein SEEHN189_01457 [Salmonella enterica subsp. enterica serovar Heidelberg str. N189]
MAARLRWGIPLALPVVEFWFHWCTKWLNATREKGLATLCIGGGQGVALTIERD